MYISEEQIKAVVRVLDDNEYRLSDGYKFYYTYDKAGGQRYDDMEDLSDISLESVLLEIAVEIIESLKKNN